MGHVLECQFEGIGRKFEILVCSYSFKKNGEQPFDLGSSAVKAGVMLEDVGVRENGAKVQVVLKYSLAHPTTRLQRKHL